MWVSFSRKTGQWFCYTKSYWIQVSISIVSIWITRKSCSFIAQTVCFTLRRAAAPNPSGKHGLTIPGMSHNQGRSFISQGQDVHIISYTITSSCWALAGDRLATFGISQQAHTIFTVTVMHQTYLQTDCLLCSGYFQSPHMVMVFYCNYFKIAKPFFLTGIAFISHKINGFLAYGRKL